MKESLKFVLVGQFRDYEFLVLFITIFAGSNKCNKYMLFIAVIEIAHRRTYIQNDFGISLGLVLSANGFVI